MESPKMYIIFGVLFFMMIIVVRIYLFFRDHKYYKNYFHRMTGGMPGPSFLYSSPPEPAPKRQGKKSEGGLYLLFIILMIGVVYLIFNPDVLSLSNAVSYQSDARVTAHKQIKKSGTKESGTKKNRINIKPGKENKFGEIQTIIDDLESARLNRRNQEHIDQEYDYEEKTLFEKDIIKDQQENVENVENLEKIDKPNHFFSIQIAAFGMEANVESMVERLRLQFENQQILVIKDAEAGRIKTMLGVFGDKASAKIFQKEIFNKMKEKGFVIDLSNFDKDEIRIF